MQVRCEFRFGRQSGGSILSAILGRFSFERSECRINFCPLRGGKCGLPAFPPPQQLSHIEGDCSEPMSIPATQLRPGMIIKHNNDLHSVFSVEHRTPGNLRAFIQAKLRNLRTGAMFEHRFRSPDPIEKVNVDEVEMQFLYADGDSYYFMDTANYEQTHLSKEILGDAVDYLIANLEIKVEFFDGKAVGIELPQTVILTVVETEPGLKSATASSVT